MQRHCTVTHWDTGRLSQMEKKKKIGENMAAHHRHQWVFQFFKADNFCYFPSTLFSSAYQTKTTADLGPQNDPLLHRIKQERNVRKKQNKTIISALFVKIARLYVKMVPLFPPAFFKNKRINMSIFTTLVSFHAVLLLFISRSASAYL